MPFKVFNNPCHPYIIMFSLLANRSTLVVIYNPIKQLYMKKIIVFLLVVVTIPALATDSLGTTVIEKFTAAFPKARHVKWYFEKDNAEVYYDYAGKRSHIWYNKEGDIVKSRSYYSEKELAPQLRSKVSSRFPKRKIAGVTEISNSDGTLYEIVLEDNKGWIYVQCDDSGELVVTKKIKKAV